MNCELFNFSIIRNFEFYVQTRKFHHQFFQSLFYYIYWSICYFIDFLGSRLVWISHRRTIQMSFYLTLSRSSSISQISPILSIYCSRCYPLNKLFSRSRILFPFFKSPYEFSLLQKISLSSCRNLFGCSTSTICFGPILLSFFNPKADVVILCTSMHIFICTREHLNYHPFGSL